MLRPHDVKRRFHDRTVIDGLSFAVRPGEVFGFLGGNGVGKTTALRMVLDIIRPDAGKIMPFGQVPGILQCSRIGFLQEKCSLYRSMRALEAVQFAGRLKGLSSERTNEEARDLRKRFGLAEHQTKKVEELSIRRRRWKSSQRAWRKRSNSLRFCILILDEPFSGLDPVNQELLEAEVRAATARGASVVFLTHIMQHAERLCDQILILNRGIKCFDGTLAEARQTIPVRVAGVSDQAPQETPALRLLECSLTEDNWFSWTAELGRSIDPADLLQYLIESGTILRKFDVARHDLHEIFIGLVGQQEPAA